MSDEDWETAFAKSVAVYLNGQGIPYLDERGQRVTDNSFVLCFNAHHEPIQFTLPPKEFGESWTRVIYTGSDGSEGSVEAGATVTVDARAVLVLQAAD
jgi:glycogen operon protein